MSASQQNFFKLAKHPFKFRMFLCYKLPAAFFSGVKLREIDEDICITSVPYKWLTQNPFRSTYFASLAMAAELSTGALAMSNTFKRVPAASMLLVKMESNYFKKATCITFFTCEEGKRMTEVLEDAYKTGLPKSITVKSSGKNITGDMIAEFFITWSFKIRQNKIG